MKKALLLDENQELCKLLNAGFKKKQSGVEIIHVSDDRDAVNAINNDNVSLFIFDITMPGAVGLTTLFNISLRYPDTPCFIITTISTPIIVEQLFNKISHFFPKPVAPRDLFVKILKVLQQPFSDNRHNKLSISSILKLIELEGKSCLLDIHRSNEYQGSLYVSKGQLCNAVYGDIVEEEAAVDLLKMEDVRLSCRVLPKKNIARLIQKDIQSLIFNALLFKENETDSNGNQEQLNQQILANEGIRLCERLEFQKAQKPFAQFVKNDPQNALGWLWLSRTLADMDKIKKALLKAYTIEPENFDIFEDIRKVRSSDTVKYKRIRRCPFCYTPVDQHATWCYYCCANLLTDPSTLSEMDISVVRRRLVAQALQRFERVLKIDLNVKILFYSGVARLNLGDLGESLTHFNSLLPILSSDNRLKNTVERAIEFIQSNQKAETQDSLPDKIKIEQKNEKLVRQEIKRPKRKTVLVVEDSPTTRKVIKMTLKKGGFRVVEATNGIEALIQLNDEHPGLVLLDIMLPKIDGYNVLSILKQNHELKNIPVIMLTSKDTIVDRVKGRLSEANTYLTKPFKPERLVIEVKKHIL